MSIQKNIQNSILRARINKEKRLKECFIDSCSKKAINAHSIQRMGALSLLESYVKNNKSIYTYTKLELNNNNETVFKPIGKIKASTFWGFCGTHDTNIFNKIENAPNDISLKNPEHKFLLCFRAFAMSYHRRKEDLNLFKKATLDKSLKQDMMKLRNLDEDGYKEYLNGAQMAVDDMKPQRDFLIDALNKKKFNSLYYFHYTVDYPVKFTSTMYTSPPYLFSGKIINISDDPNYVYSDIISTIIPLKNKTLVVLASFKDRPNGIKYLKELQRFRKSKKEIALTWHFLTNSENVFFSPIWFDSLPKKEQQLIIKLYLDSDDQNKPYLKFNSCKFKLNLFENVNPIPKKWWQLWK